MNYTTEKEIFTHQLKKFANTLAMHIAKDDEWTVEPFMGSGVVGFNIAPENAIFSDTNPHIINFYTQIQNGIITPQKVRDFLEYEGEKLAASDAEYYIYVRNRFNAEHDPLDFLFLNRSCFNGMMRFNKNNDFNVPYGHKPERFAKAYITKIVNQVAFVQTKIKLNNWFLYVNHSMKLSVCGRTCICGCGERMQSFDTGGRRYARLWSSSVTMPIMNKLSMKESPVRFEKRRSGSDVW